MTHLHRTPVSGLTDPCDRGMVNKLLDLCLTSSPINGDDEGFLFLFCGTIIH